MSGEDEDKTSSEGPFTVAYRFSSERPAKRACFRVRHLLTVSGRTYNEAATSFVVFPAAASKSMRARCARRCSVAVLRTQVSKVFGSSSLNPRNVATPMSGVWHLMLFIDSRYWYTEKRYFHLQNTDQRLGRWQRHPGRESGW